MAPLTLEALILGYALDTNGGNARFVHAAERWGTDPDVLKVFAVGRYDPAGVVGRFQLAAEKTDSLRIRSAHRSEAYFEFPRDILWDRSTDQLVRTLAKEADVIHLNNSWKAYRQLRLRTPGLLHHHGSLFRSNPAALLSVARALHFVQAVSTIDLQRVAPDVLHWLPTAYDIDALGAFGAAHRRTPDGRIRVVSAPTNRMWKSTDALEAAVTLVQAEGLPVDLVLVEGRTWAECMAMKATADIYFDQVILGYGCNAIEAWGMGVPVIAGADAWTLDRMRSEFPLPFHEATPDTIAASIRALARSADLRADYAARGMAHVRRFHDEKPALARLAELYVQAMAEYERPTPSVSVRPAPGGSWAQLAQQRRDERLAQRHALKVAP